MADEIRKILQELELTEYIEAFEKNKVTLDVLKYMNENDIKELIPLIGHRVIFLNHWKSKYCTSSTFNSEENSQNNNRINIEKEVDEICVSVTKKKIARTQDNNRLRDEVHVSLISSIRQILSDNIIGETIIERYRQKNELNQKSRSSLCHIIISYLQNNKIKRSNKIIRYMAEKIVEEFPTESLKTYYISPVKKRNSLIKKPIPARGKLVNLWRNSDCRFKKFALSTSDDTEDDESESENDAEETIQQSLEWLKKHQAPWETVKIHWNITYNVRYKDMQQHKDKVLSTLFEKWQILKHPLGHELIDFDFKKMNLTQVLLDIETWNTFVKGVLKCVTLKESDDTATNLFNKYEDTQNNEDTIVIASLMLLAHVLPPCKMIRHNKQFYKPSIVDAKESIIKHLQNSGDVTIHRETIKKKAEQLNITVQPYIIIIGKTLQEIQNFFVCIDEVLYSVESALQAVDMCFKVFHVLHLNYPIFSDYLWLMLQKGIYNINTKWDSVFSNTEHIIKYLNSAVSTSEIQ